MATLMVPVVQEHPGVRHIHLLSLLRGEEPGPTMFQPPPAHPCRLQQQGWGIKETKLKGCFGQGP